MAIKSKKEAEANNLESDIKEKTPYRVTFGMFQEIEKYNEKLGTNIDVMKLPPENSKEYKDLLKMLELHQMVIETSNFKKVLGKNGVIVARVGEDGKVLTGKVPEKKSKTAAKKSTAKANEEK